MAKKPQPSHFWPLLRQNHTEHGASSAGTQLIVHLQEINWRSPSFAVNHPYCCIYGSAGDQLNSSRSVQLMTAENSQDASILAILAAF